MTAALERGEWSAARPGRSLPPGKTRYPLYRSLGGPQGRSGRAENLAPLGFDPRTVQPVASRYIDWATRAPWAVSLQLLIAEASSSILGYSKWCLWLAKWHQNRFLPVHFGVPFVPSHQRSTVINSSLTLWYLSIWHHDMARHRVADGRGDLQIWREAVNLYIE